MKSSLQVSLLALVFMSCQLLSSQQEFVHVGKIIKGVCFVAPNKVMPAEEFEPLKKINATWVAITPYGFCRKNEAKFVYAKDTSTRKWQWWGERPDGTTACIKMAHAKGLKVMLKPHVWVAGDEHIYTGDLDYKTNEDWSKFEADYREYILEFAKIAADNSVEIYCIATEFHTFIAKRPDFWKGLIADVKKIYKGKLTYAENWDKYQEVTFWNELDFIGIDAYFPLSDKKNPSLSDLKKGWKKPLKEIKSYSTKVQKPVLFTEIGYQSTDFSAKEPWASYSKEADNQDIQSNAYQAFFDEVWQQQWFAGAFVWKWFPFLKDKESSRDKYSPQNKKALEVLNQNFKTLR